MREGQSTAVLPPPSTASLLRLHITRPRGPLLRVSASPSGLQSNASRSVNWAPSPRDSCPKICCCFPRSFLHVLHMDTAHRRVCAAYLSRPMGDKQVCSALWDARPPADRISSPIQPLTASHPDTSSSQLFPGSSVTAQLTYLSHIAPFAQFTLSAHSQ